MGISLKFVIFITFKTRDKTFPHIRHDQYLLLLCYLRQKIMQNEKKSEIFKKRNFLGQALDFLPPRKPGLSISRVDFFFFEYHEQTLSSGQNLSKPVKILISCTKSRNRHSRNHSTLRFCGQMPNT